MPTDHEEPCDFHHRSFCLNGGICYVIPRISSPFCRCIENYTGARCEEVFLPSARVQSKSDLFMTYVVLALLGTLIIVAFYFFCRKAQRNNSAQYDINLEEIPDTSADNSEYIQKEMLVSKSQIMENPDETNIKANQRISSVTEKEEMP